jgi:hypothetical protein
MVASSPSPAYQHTKSVIPSAMLFSHTSKRGNLFTSIHSFVFFFASASRRLLISFIFSKLKAHGTRLTASLSLFSTPAAFYRFLPFMQ